MAGGTEGGVAVGPLEPPATAAAAAPLAALWDATFAPALPLDPAALAARFAPLRAGDAVEVLLGARDVDGALVGVLWARAPARPWSPPELAVLEGLVVAPAARGRGVGTRLWRAAAERLAAEGRTRVALGGGPFRLAPGVPLAAPDATGRFLRRAGFRFGGIELDVHLDLRAGVDGPPLPPGAELRDDLPEEALAFVRRAFPGRWADEVEVAVRAGRPPLLLREGGEAIGFCAAFDPDDVHLAPALAWRGALPGPVAAIGPLGLDPAARGGGRGIGMVRAAAARARARGALDLLIDWTTLAPFYARAGARAWRAWQRAEADLSARQRAEADLSARQRAEPPRLGRKESRP